MQLKYPTCPICHSPWSHLRGEHQVRDTGTFWCVGEASGEKHDALWLYQNARDVEDAELDLEVNCLDGHDYLVQWNHNAGLTHLYLVDEDSPESGLLFTFGDPIPFTVSREELRKLLADGPYGTPKKRELDRYVEFLEQEDKLSEGKPNPETLRRMEEMPMVEEDTHLESPLALSQFLRDNQQRTDRVMENRELDLLVAHGDLKFYTRLYKDISDRELPKGLGQYAHEELTLVFPSGHRLVIRSAMKAGENTQLLIGDK